jgi:hypothetical protein
MRNGSPYSWQCYRWYLFIFIGSLYCCLAAYGAGPGVERPASLSQTRDVKSGDAQFDPLNEIATSFPGSIKLNEKGRLLEFCPDETCDGFVISNNVSMATLKDFAYLYIYYFSDYLAYLPEWRKHDDAKNTAERVLSKPEYRDCQEDNSRESARCVLLSLSQKGAIRLIFIRYDEGKRNVVPEDIFKELKPAHK